MSTSARSLDTVLLVTVVGLVLFGFVMVTSASSVLAERFRGDQYFYIKHQILYGGSVGLLAVLMGAWIPYRFWRTLAIPALGVTIIMLLLVYVPGLRVEYGGASRWITLGPITVQPSEIVKFTFIVYVAALLERKGEAIQHFGQTVLPFLIVLGIIGLLIIKQPDMGTLFSVVVIAGAMVFTAGFRIRHLALIALAAAAVLSVLVNTRSYRLSRIIVYLHPELDPQGIGYQINQALLAIGTGGWWGLGFGRSRQKYQYLPEPAGDSIFAIVAEELGLLRTSVLIIAYLIIAYRGYAIARRAPDVFGRLLACGITTWILTQAFINMGALLGLMPLTGIPLPFISLGGSALVTMLLGVGVLLNISTQAHATKP